ncbi:hypothetical protein EST38_g9385 [Candolleomyces aberdarensis]|uniref:Uncharacterized protein n=1 Tax=Candolleomyces aberdarensis TaxID=2316362 RepID=A0A4Q2DAV1_9AGAR|nr:hypothetical protein EST38_g9385 [Candolleomyces aberdarensis]
MNRADAKFIHKTLLACDRTPLQQLSPMWQSPEILYQIARHIEILPGSKTDWISRGIDPFTFTVALSTLPQAPDEDEGEGEDGGSDVNASVKEKSKAPQVHCDQPPVQEPLIEHRQSPSSSKLFNPAQGKAAPLVFGSLERIDPIQMTRLPTASTLTSGATSKGSDHHQQTPIFTPGPQAPAPVTNVNSAVTMAKFLARVVIKVLQELDLECAIFGSTACQLYGNARSPEDLDVLVLPPASFSHDTEWIKYQIVQRRPRMFKLTPGRSPGATYHVLIFSFGVYGDPMVALKKYWKSEVDIFLPGTMHLPRLTSRDITWKEGLPLLPFLTLLLQKLQGWGDHLESSEPNKFKKHVVDSQDIAGLLSLSESLPLTISRPWRERYLMSDEFQAASSARVKKFCRIFPATKPAWSTLGLDVE